MFDRTEQIAYEDKITELEDEIEDLKKGKMRLYEAIENYKTNSNYGTGVCVVLALFVGFIFGWGLYFLVEKGSGL